MHGFVGGLCEEWKWKQSGVVSACMLDYVKSGSGSSQVVSACMVLSVGCVKSGGGSSQSRCMCAWCCRWAV